MANGTEIPTANHVTLLMSGPSNQFMNKQPECLWCQGFMLKFLKLREMNPSAWWDIHRDETWTGLKLWNPDYQGWLASQNRPVVMWRAQESIPTSTAVPDIVKAWGKQEPFAGTIDWMIATAIHLGVEKLSLYGVDYVTAHERLYQTFGLAYWIGKAIGLGIEVKLPGTCRALWNILPGNYGPDFPPWPTEHDPRGWQFHGSELNAYTSLALDRPSALVPAPPRYPLPQKQLAEVE